MREPTTTTHPAARSAGIMRARELGAGEVAEVEPRATPVPRRPKVFELGLLLVVVGAPLVFLPMSAGPFVDVKLAVVLAGALAMWAGAPAADRMLCGAAALWVGVLALAALVGVDRWWGLVGVDNLSGGLLLLGPSAYLLVAGASMPAELSRRIPTWLLATGVPVGIVTIAWRFAPGAMDALVRDLSFEGSTLGHPVLVSGFCTVALLAATSARARRSVWFFLALVVVASGLSLSTKRAGLVALALGLVVAWWRAKERRRDVTRIGAVVLAVLLGWAALDAVVAPEQGLSAAPRFGELASDSARSRVVIHEVLLRAWAERPLLGWGTGATWGAYLSTATADEVAIAHRGVADAHDIVLGTAVTSGILGLAALAWLGWLALRRARRAPTTLSWALGSAAGLFAFHLLQPMSAPLTPLLFLLLGVSASAASVSARSPARTGRTARTARTGRTGRTGRSIVGVLLAAGLAVSVLVLASSVLERWGGTYNSQWSLRLAHTLAPGRVTVVQTLAVYRAQDGEDPDAAAEARRLVAELVDAHPAHPGVRMVGVVVELVLDDPAAAHGWLERQVTAFPGDVASFPEGMVTFLRTGEPPSTPSALQSELAPADESG